MARPSGTGYDAVDAAEKYTYKIQITTGNYLGQNVKRHCTVCLRIYGKDRHDGDNQIYSVSGGWFRPGSKASKTVTSKVAAADIEQLELWIERTGNETALNWFVEVITINPGRPDQKMYPFNRWITMRHQIVQLNDSLLPQNDKNAKRRSEAILLDKDWFYFTVTDIIPVMVDNKSNSERFSLSYYFNVFLKTGFFNKIKEFLLPCFTRKWRHLTDTGNIYNRPILHFPTPKWVHKYINVFKKGDEDDWEELDEVFAAQRLTGTNPLVIRRVTTRAITETIDVDEGKLSELMDGMSLDDAIQARLLYKVDYTDILHELPCKTGLIAAPIALFFVKNKGTVNEKLMPVAIQLFMKDTKSTKGEDNPVFYPPPIDDDKHTWFLAKMWFNNADASYHQSVSHLGFTHLLMETAYIALRQTVSLSHPIYRLMAPHFLYLLRINTEAWNLLVNEGGWVDTSMSIGVEGMFEIIRRRYEGFRGVQPWRLDTEGDVKKDIEDREVEHIPNYMFRDDAKELHEIISNYVGTVVTNHYEDPQYLKGDYEIQAWAEMLCKPSKDGGCGMKGVPGEGTFSEVQHLIDTVTSLIYISSVGHAAVNFQQYNEYGYSLHYPALLYGDPPRDKNARDEHDILQVLPTKPTTLGTMNITNILSQRQTRSLGDFEVPYQFDKVGTDAVETFRKNLGELQTKLCERNDKQTDPYDVLNPDDIPNAISI